MSTALVTSAPPDVHSDPATVAQIRREQEMVERGIQTYRKLMATKRGAAQSSPGQELLARLYFQVLPAFKTLRQNAVAKLASARGEVNVSKWTLVAAAIPKTAAVIAAYAVFNLRYKARRAKYDESVNTPFNRVARMIGWKIIREQQHRAERRLRRLQSQLRLAQALERQGNEESARQAFEEILAKGGLRHGQFRLVHAAAFEGARRTGGHGNVVVRSHGVCRSVERTISDHRRISARNRERLREIEAVEHGVVERSLDADEAMHGSERPFAADEIIAVGAEFAYALMTTCGDVFDLGDDGQGKKQGRYRVFSFNAAARQRWAEAQAELESGRPELLPMLCPPMDWREQDGGYVGGYLRERMPFFGRTKGRRHTAGAVRPAGRQVLSAVNALQRTPFRVNKRVLNVLLKLKGTRTGRRLKLPPKDRVEAPAWLSKRQWEALGALERAEMMRKMRMANEANVGRREFARLLERAQEEEKHGAIWLPHFCDFRGRVNQYPQDLYFQGSKIARSLLTFAEGKRLGKDGEQWLLLRAAGCYGGEVGRMSVRDRITWAEENITTLRRLGKSPLKEREFWRQASEPWALLAVAQELTDLHDQGAQSFLNFVPLSVDGRCNGLQHLAAVTLDPFLAQTVNLAPNEVPSDLYGLLASSLSDRLQASNADAARRWLARGVDRTLMKKPIMTFPYGITRRGIMEQLLIVSRDTPLHAWDDAMFLTDEVINLVESRLHAATRIRELLGTWAGMLAGEQKPAIWRTPAGLSVTMAYHKSRRKLIRVQRASINWRLEDLDAPLLAEKQTRSMMPNVIHSWDASHLMLTVNACSRADINHLATVHDSYGTHACDMTRMNTILREQFVEMYAGDPLANLHAQLQEQVGSGLSLPPPPARGTFDLNQVLKSEFFFA